MIKTGHIQTGTHPTSSFLKQHSANSVKKYSIKTVNENITIQTDISTNQPALQADSS